MGMHSRASWPSGSGSLVPGGVGIPPSHSSSTSPPVTSPNSELTGVVLGEEAGEIQIKEVMSDVKQTGPQRQDYLSFTE